jgi:uncharacterized membrane protein YgcG
MRYIIFIPILLLNFAAIAQDNRQTIYSYTNASKKYLPDTVIDSIIYKTSKDVFAENGIPHQLFESKYPSLKSVVWTLTRTDVITSFASLAKNGRSGTGSKTFAGDGTLKSAYHNALANAVRSGFAKYQVLKMYLKLNGEDRITSFDSRVQVNEDASLLVTETIRVYNGDGEVNPIYANDPQYGDEGVGDNNQIKRGIVRTFPLYYINKHHLFQNTTFTLKEVTRDGKPEKYHTEYKENGVLVYTGDKNILLEPGFYTYTITYETKHQLKFMSDFDELYWNVTGTGWSFRMDSASCTVVLPKSAKALNNACYTGAQGATGNDCKVQTFTLGDKNIVEFKTTRPLQPYQGLTIATSWPKGNVVTTGENWWYYFWNNKAVFFLPLAALFSAIFCFIKWKRYGRDPEKGTVYPQYEPPPNLSPAAVGYILRQKFSQKFTAATLVDAAVRRKIKIDVEKGGIIFKHNEYLITRGTEKIIPPKTPYHDFEHEVNRLLNTTIKPGTYNSAVAALNTAVSAYCTKTYKNKDGRKGLLSKGFFSLNRSFTAIPILITIVAAVWAFVDGLVRALTMFEFWQATYYVAGLILCIVVITIFAKLLPAYNAEGRALTDKIEGFKMFLTTADQSRFDMLTPPDKSLELYERYLPYAIALGCEIEWGNQFTDILTSAYLNSSVASHSFVHTFAQHSGGFSSSFTSSFSGAISSASTPPSSSGSSGSSGGGSSGGGGGGGGGGGW